MTDTDVLRIIATLVFILMVILGGAWVVRRSGLGRSGPPQALRTIASQSLGNRAWVAIVEVEDARLVLGITSQQISLLHKLPPSPRDDAGEGQNAGDQQNDPPGFTSALTRALKRR